jgi:hypothetical protein
MKCLKLLGIASIAAMGLIGSAGVGSASATALCTATTMPECEGAHRYGVGTAINFSMISGGSAKQTDSNGNTLSTCTQGTWKGTVKNAGGSAATVVIGLEQLTWIGCSQTTHTVQNGRLEIHRVAGTHNGTVVGQATEWTQNIFGVSCTYGFGTGTHLGTLAGGSSSVLKIATTITKTAGGFLCPSTVGWDAEYVLTEPHALYVTTG